MCCPPFENRRGGKPHGAGIRQPENGRTAGRSGGIVFERNSVGSLVYPPGGAIDEKLRHATGGNTHQLIEQPHEYVFALFGPHQVCSFESELLIEHDTNGRISFSYWRNAT